MNWRVALLYRIIDCLGPVADLTHFFVVLIADFLLSSFKLSDVCVVALLYRPGSNTLMTSVTESPTYL